MSNRTRAIREAIIATLARINGAGVYTNNNLVPAFGQQPRVWTGVYQVPPAAPKQGWPVVAIRCLGIDADNTSAMTQFDHEGSWALDCWTAGDPKKPADRMSTAEDLLDDLKTALRSNIGLIHTSTGLAGYSARNLVDRLTVNATPFTESLAHQGRNAQQYGRVLVGISCWWREDLPAQVIAP